MVLPASIAAKTASSAAVPDEAHNTMSTSGWVATAISASQPAPCVLGSREPSPVRSSSIAAPVAMAIARGW
jgi:hypothetical protein